MLLSLIFFSDLSTNVSDDELNHFEEFIGFVNSLDLVKGFNCSDDEY
ncbi:hypothetical protein CASFOL_036526 [Castilleja foliolosa]|uniref:Uncharacterized protein n=1 Tax=Castilleja foliolosa TaxID=1961234 RepID=A0ABD3BWF5_9LAMI